MQPWHIISLTAYIKAGATQDLSLAAMAHQVVSGLLLGAVEVV